MNSLKVTVVAIWLQNGRDWDNTYKAILNKVNPYQTYVDEAKRYISLYGEDNVLTIIDDKYMELGLFKLGKPPLVINLKECN